MQETSAGSLGGEDALEADMGNPFQYSFLEKPGGLQYIGLQSRTGLRRFNTHTHTHTVLANPK